MRNIDKRYVRNDYCKRNFTVVEISKYRRLCTKTISKFLKSEGLLLSFTDKKKLREKFDLTTIPFELREHSLYYVYGLLDPFSGEVFYIGKGKSERYRDHFFEARNPIKKARIQSIIDRGGTVEVQFYGKDLTEEKALLLEMSLIQENEKLVNIRRK